MNKNEYYSSDRDGCFVFVYFLVAVFVIVILANITGDHAVRDVTAVLLSILAIVVFFSTLGIMQWRRQIETDKRRREEVEHAESLRRRKEELMQGPGADLVRRFSKAGSFEDADYHKLGQLIARNGPHFSEQELKELVHEVGGQRFSEVLSAEMEENVTLVTLEDYVSRYAVVKREHDLDEEGDKALLRILEAKGLPYDCGEVRALLSKASRKLELDAYEKRLLDPAGNPTIEDTDSMTGSDFEQFLGRLFGAMGFTVEETPASGDQGADLILSRTGERLVVQAKRHAGSVGNSAVQEVVAAVSFYSATRGLVVTNSTFTSAAVALAAANGVELVDRDALGELISRHL